MTEQLAGFCLFIYCHSTLQYLTLTYCVMQVWVHTKEQEGKAWLYRSDDLTRITTKPQEGDRG